MLNIILQFDSQFNMNHSRFNIYFMISLLSWIIKLFPSCFFCGFDANAIKNHQDQLCPLIMIF